MIATAHVAITWHMREVFVKRTVQSGSLNLDSGLVCPNEEGGNKGAKEGVRRIPKPWLQMCCMVG